MHSAFIYADIAGDFFDSLATMSAWISAAVGDPEESGAVGLVVVLPERGVGFVLLELLWVELAFMLSADAVLACAFHAVLVRTG